MREILFKAKSLDNGEWVEGSYAYVEHLGEHFILSSEKVDMGFDICFTTSQYRIDENTLCQYTGLTDKNGYAIWENDIVQTQEYSDKPYAKNRKFKRHVGTVEYHIGQGDGFYNEEEKKYNKHCEYSAEWIVKINDYGKYSCSSWGDFFDCEVIGNIFDNPELLVK